MTLRVLPAILLVACKADLPPGWEDAERVGDFTQTACEGSPYDSGLPDPEVTAARVDGEIDVAAEPVTFRCEQEVEAFWRQEGTLASMLVQPIDMHPNMVAGCDCVYRVEGFLPSADAARVAVWRRWDAINEPNDPVKVGEADVVP